MKIKNIRSNIHKFDSARSDIIPERTGAVLGKPFDETVQSSTHQFEPLQIAPLERPFEDKAFLPFCDENGEGEKCVVKDQKTPMIFPKQDGQMQSNEMYMQNIKRQLEQIYRQIEMLKDKAEQLQQKFEGREEGRMDRAIDMREDRFKRDKKTREWMEEKKEEMIYESVEMDGDREKRWIQEGRDEFMLREEGKTELPHILPPKEKRRENTPEMKTEGDYGEPPTKVEKVRIPLFKIFRNKDKEIRLSPRSEEGMRKSGLDANMFIETAGQEVLVQEKRGVFRWLPW